MDLSHLPPGTISLSLNVKYFAVVVPAAKLPSLQRSGRFLFVNGISWVCAAAGEAPPGGGFALSR